MLQILQMNDANDDIATVRQRYAKATAEAAGCAGSAIEEAFAAIAREDFLPPPPWQVYGSAIGRRLVTSDPAELYCDGLVAIDLAQGINNGQPSLHAGWIAAAAPQPGETVVHVGAGGGYYSAILARLVGMEGHVHAYEIEPSVARLAVRALEPYANVTLYPVSGSGGALPAADIVYVNAAATAPQRAWLEALRPGGRLVFPWSFASYGTAAMLVTRTGDATPAIFKARAIGGVAFIAMEEEHEHRRGSADSGAVLAIRSLLPKASQAPDTTMVADCDTHWFSTRETIR